MAKLFDDSITLMRKEPNMLRIDGNVVIFGDIHGQFHDLLDIFEQTGLPSRDRTFLFLGDYVDRGDNNVEVMAYLMTLKLAFPNNVFLLRGNHETEGCLYSPARDAYKTYKEYLSKYDKEIIEKLLDLFTVMPLAAKVNGLYFCCHGGIDPKMQSFDDINSERVFRFKREPRSGLLLQLLWNDPIDTPGQHPDG